MEFENVPHLLIVAPNWLGDAVMALPAIEDLARAMPEATLSVAARPAVAPLFTMVRSVHEVSSEPGRNKPVAAALLLRNSFHSALALWRAGVPERWGYRTDFRGPLLTRAVPLPARPVHQAEYYQHLVFSLGYPNGPLRPRLDPTPSARARGEEVLRAVGWDGRAPLVALAPGAAYGGAKRWPARSFAEVAAALSREGVATVLIGGPGDTVAGRELKQQFSGVLDAIGRTDLPALAGLLVKCRGLVSNDSGAMHFGAALGVRVVAMFGPTDERATRPFGQSPSPDPVVLTNPVWCRPCLLRECPLTHACMRGIDVDTVTKAILPALEGGV
jgi:heptosyltransferase-2